MKINEVLGEILPPGKYAPWSELRLIGRTELATEEATNCFKNGEPWRNRTSDTRIKSPTSEGKS